MTNEKLKLEIKNLRQSYHFVNPRQIRSFLSVHPRLIKRLGKLYEEMASLFDTTDIKAELVTDVEYRYWKTLFIRVDIDEHLENRDLLIDSLIDWMFKQSKEFKEFVNVDF